ncbi:MAG: SDR family oxidoreductase [Phycisphaera sp.]|nr:MAG: SDR family oxidoreductase [Phycisphaera sp.]
MPDRPHHLHDSKRLLITGVAGFLGRHLACVAHDAGYEITGVLRFTPECSTPNMTDFVRADLAEPRAAQDAIDRLSPDAIIHCAANARTNECERFPEAAQRDNVLATELLALACEGIPLVVCSTDLVFDGHRPGGMYREDDEPHPINAYGRSKLAMERRLREMGSNAVIARLPLLFGPPAAEGASGCFLSAWVEHLRKREDLVLFTDEWRTPLSARDAARGLLACLERGEPGEVYHVPGGERVDRLELGRRFARFAAEPLRFDAGLMRPGVQADVPMAAPRARDVSLDGARAASTLGFEPGTLDEELEWTAGVMADRL